MDPRPPSEKARGNDPRVVEHQQFIAPQELGQLQKPPILPLPLLAVEQEQSGGIPQWQRSLRDLPTRQLVVKLLDTHVPESLSHVNVRGNGQRRWVTPAARPATLRQLFWRHIIHITHNL